MTDRSGHQAMIARRCYWLLVLVAVAATVLAWMTLPDRVPLHFGASGEPDRWGSRLEAVLTMGALKAGLVLLFWGLAVWVPRIPESLLNLPARDKEWWLATPERRAVLDARLAADLYIMGALTIAFIVVNELGTVVAAREDTGLGPWFWIGLALYLVAILGYTGYMVAVRYRRPRGDATGPDRLEG